MNDLITPISYEQYDKISDDIYFIGNNTIMKFNVSLSKDINNMRSHFHKEFKYNSKYSNCNSLVTIKRSFDFYISIENIKKDDSGIKEFIRIGVSEILLVRYKLQEVLKWFTSNEFQNLYGKKGKKLLILGRVSNIIIDRLPMNKYIEFEPTVCDYDTESVPGVRMYLSSKTNYVDINVDRLMGLIYLMDSINMYESAQLMINYLQRPENGTNLYSFTGQEAEMETKTIEGVRAKEGRRIPIKNNSLSNL